MVYANNEMKLNYANTPPDSLLPKISDFHLKETEKCRVLWVGERFGETIGWHDCGGDVRYVDPIFVDCFSNDVKLDINVFRALIGKRVSREGKSGLVVGEYVNGIDRSASDGLH
jgi:hypothetical protein